MLSRHELSFHVYTESALNALKARGKRNFRKLHAGSAEYKTDRVYIRRSKPINNFDLRTGFRIWINIMRLNVTPYSRFAVPCIPVTLFKHPTDFFSPDQIGSKCRRRRKDCESVEQGLDRGCWSGTISYPTEPLLNRKGTGISCSRNW